MPPLHLCTAVVPDHSPLIAPTCILEFIVPAKTTAIKFLKGPIMQVLAYFGVNKDVGLAEADVEKVTWLFLAVLMSLPPISLPSECLLVCKDTGSMVPGGFQSLLTWPF